MLGNHEDVAKCSRPDPESEQAEAEMVWKLLMVNPEEDLVFGAETTDGGDQGIDAGGEAAYGTQ